MTDTTLTEAMEHLSSQQTRLRAAKDALELDEAMTEEERLDALDEAECAYDDVCEAASIVARLSHRQESPRRARPTRVRRFDSGREVEQALVAMLRLTIELLGKRAA